MNFDFLGGALEIGGSSILLQLDGKKILLDSGIRQGGNQDPLPNFKAIQDAGGLDAIIISHAHLDHIGSLPLISKEYPAARIYMNPMTRDLVRVQLYDSLKIMKNREVEIPLYAEQDVIETLNRIYSIGYEVRFAIFEDIYLTLYNAGHIAGASFCYLQGKEGTVFYSGDFSVFSQRSIEGAKLPKLRPDVAIVETTYGDKLHSNREIEEMALIQMINEAIETNGKVLIPAFALGRAQEVILILKSAMNKGILKKVKVYVDGMIRDVNRVYNQNPIYLKQSLAKKILRGMEPFYDDNIIEVMPDMKREELLADKEAVVFVASSGMLNGGPSTFYAEKIAAMENGYIAITGYQDEESPGRQLMALLEDSTEDRRLSLNGISFPVRCKIKKIGLSAHADKSEIGGVIERLSARNVIMVHGNGEVIYSLSKEVAANYPGRVYAPSCGEQIAITIRNPRKQLKNEFPFVMNRKEELSEENIRTLYGYVFEKYGKQLLTVENLYYIWHGIKSNEEEVLQKFCASIRDSVYFEPDRKRLFLWKAREEKDIAIDLQQKEMTQQQLIAKVDELFYEYPYKKISISNENKSITLVFDFPDAVDSAIKLLILHFTEETGWNIGINENMNINSADILIRGYFDYDYIEKLSFFALEKKAHLVLKKELDISKIDTVTVDFKKQTGWDLLINQENQKGVVEKERGSDYYCTSNVNAVEQNEALYLIDLAFEEERHKPYKKSIKQNGQGKYIELVFVTPMIGRRYVKVIESLANQIGWDFTISDKVNQNELLNRTILLCQKYQVTLRKNPSYHPTTMRILVQLADGAEHFAEVKEELFEITGCEVEVNG